MTFSYNLIKASLHNTYLFQTLIKGLHIQYYLFYGPTLSTDYPWIDLKTASFHQTSRTRGVAISIDRIRNEA